MNCYFLFQEIFLTQGLKLCLLHWQVNSLPPSNLGSPEQLCCSLLLRQVRGCGIGTDWPLSGFLRILPVTLGNLTGQKDLLAAAVAKSLQLCPTLCDPRDDSPLGILSLGFSRQEHWSRLLYPSPMHESENWKWSRSVVSDSSDPMDCSLPGSYVHGIFQARVVEWVAIAFSKICLGWSILESVLFSARTNSSIILIRTKSCYHFFLLWYTLVKILEYWLKLWILTRFCSVWCRTGIIELFNQFHNLCKHWKKFNSSKLWTSNVSLSVLVLGHPYQRASLSSHNQEKTELESFQISMERIWASETPSGHKNYALFLFS